MASSTASAANPPSTKTIRARKRLCNSKRHSSINTSAAIAGPIITIDSPHRINNDFNRGSSLSAPDAIISAPVVENGGASLTPKRVIDGIWTDFAAYRAAGR